MAERDYRIPFACKLPEEVLRSADDHADDLVLGRDKFIELAVRRLIAEIDANPEAFRALG